MRKLFVPTLVICCMLFALSACKKESAGPSTPAPPHAAGNATVNAISLNGGNLTGRWTSNLYYTVTYRNDTFQTEMTDTVSAGAEIVHFLPNGIVTLWIDDTIFVDSSAYTINGNVLTVITSTQDTTVFTYGVSGNRMRWHSTYIDVMPPNVIRAEEDVVLERY